MADLFLDPARLDKWRAICRSDPERVLRVFHLDPPPAKSPEGDTGDEMIAVMQALQEIVGQDVSEKPEPAWKDLVEAGIIEELCHSVHTLVMEVKSTTSEGVPKEIYESVATLGPSPCILPFTILNKGAAHFSEPPGPLDKRMLSALKSKWAGMMQSIWENPQHTLLPDPFHSRARSAICHLFLSVCLADPKFKHLAFNDFTVPVMTRMWIASAASEGDGMDAILTSMVMKGLFSPFDDPSDEQRKTNPVVPNLKHVVPLVYLGANAQYGASRLSQANALVEGFVKYFKWGELKNDIQLPLAFLFLFLDQKDPDFARAVWRSERFWKSLFSLLKYLLRAMSGTHSEEYERLTLSISLCLQTLSEISVQVPRDKLAEFILLLIRCDLFELLDKRIEDIISIEQRLFVCANFPSLFLRILSVLQDGDPSFKEAIAQQLPRANLVKSLFRWDVAVAGITAQNSPAQRAMAANPLSKAAGTTWRVIAQIQIACIGKDGCTKRGCKNISKSRCSGCQVAMYCSAECQKQDWKEHKKACQFLPLMDPFK